MKKEKDSKIPNIVKIRLNDIKEPDLWLEMARKLKLEKFKGEHPELIDDECDDSVNDAFREQVLDQYFEFCEYADLEIHIDENFKIVGGSILKRGCSEDDDE